MASERVVLVDGSWLIFRAYYAIPSNLTTSAGLHTNAIYGFATMFRKLMSGRSPRYGAVVFDPPGPTQRDLEYPDYKADRPSMADDLVEQLPWIEKVVTAHNFPVLRVDGWEADDVIGTLCRMAVDDGHDVTIVSSDKDYAQLVTDDVRMLDTMRDVTYDPDLVFKKWGARPNRIIDLLALMGDKVDNIPGVPGVGKKTAARLLDAYGSVTGVYENIDELKGKLRQNLEEHRDEALMSRSLVTIHQDADIGVELTDIEVQAPEPAAVNALFTELEFYSLLAKAPDSGDATEDDAEYRTCGSLADVDDAITAARADDEPVAIELLFNYEDQAPRFGGLAGIALGLRKGLGIYVPLESAESNLGNDALTRLGGWLEDPEAPKIVHDAKLAIRELKRRGLTLAGIAGDTMLASFLIDPTGPIPHDLPRVIKQYLHRVPHKPKTVVGSGKKMKAFGAVAAADSGSYACHLAVAIRQLWPRLSAKLEEAGQVGQLFEHDLPLSFVLADMELAGILVDRDDLEAMGREFRGRLAEIEAEIFRLAGREFNVNSHKQLSEVLFEDLELPVIRRTKTGYSTAADVLERLAPDHEIAAHLLDYRKLAKLINTYTDVLSAAVDPEDGRIHATFNQTVSATGRLISTDPDLQRTPVKTDEGKRIRRTFIASEGNRLISADWSQIELRLLAHVTRDERLVEAFQTGADVHARTAAELFDCAVEDVTPKQRSTGKLVNFATIYGQGATALGKILGVPRKEAKAYIDHYFQVYASVREWLDNTIETAREKGFVETLSGRRRYIPELSSKNPMDRTAGERIAANTPIQGSAADICKDVMLQIPRLLREAGLQTRMLLQIHDELLFESPQAEVESASAIIKDAMESIVALKVPLVADVGVGQNWDEAHL